MVRPDDANAAALFRALVTFGAPLARVEPADLIQSGSFYRMGAPPVMVDVLPNIAGIDFDDAWARRHRAKVEPDSQIEACFISADDLIAAKLAAGRAQDLADVEALREAARRRLGGKLIHAMQWTG